MVQGDSQAFAIAADRVLAELSARTRAKVQLTPEQRPEEVMWAPDFLKKVREDADQATYSP